MRQSYKLSSDTFLQQNYCYTLFQTEAWRRAWTEAWLPYLNSHPDIEIESSVPVYHCRHRIRRLVPVESTVSFGCPIRGVPSIRSEYGSWQEELPELIRKTRQQLVLPDVVEGSGSADAIYAKATAEGHRVIKKDPSTAYSVDLSHGTFQEYLSSLSANTRVKLYNRRKRLAQIGLVEIINMWPDIDGFVATLNDFHQRRWGRPCYSGNNLQFIKRLLEHLDNDGHGINLSALKVNQKVESVMLDLQIAGRTYNLQTGFNEFIAKGVSLGMLHFGYQLEGGFLSETQKVYDFMAGRGKKSNYKEALANQYCRMSTLVIVKSSWLKTLYRLQGALPG